MRKERPNLIFGFGGYVSFPISFASRFFNIPLVLYENNLALGRTNKSLLPLSKKIFLATNSITNVPEKYKNKICKVGNILREEIINYSTVEKKHKNGIFGILVLGGSQGAEVFGKIIPPVIKILKDKGHEIEVIQQCIESQKNSLVEFYSKHNIKNKVFIFSDNILDLISSSDLAISRCGASTAAELVSTLTPFIAVPYPYSMDNHQYLNAKYYSYKKYCWLLEEDNLNTRSLFNLIHEIIIDKKKLESIRYNMKKNHGNNVYNNIENIVKDFFKNEN